VLTAAHSFVQNLRRGHCEPPSPARPPVNRASLKMSDHGGRGPEALRILLLAAD